VAVGALSAGQARALVVNVGGQDWDVTTFTGSYNDNPAKFALPPIGVMPWWGDQGLAIEFATAVGLPSPGIFGYFYGPSQLGDVVDFADYSEEGVGISKALSSSSRPWAQATLVPATAVPAPLPVFGATAAFGFSRQLRKRIKASKGVSSKAKTV
jgi:hypothetical protein